MKTLAVLFSVLFLTAACSDSNKSYVEDFSYSSKIVNGVASQLSKHPWQVSLQRWGQHFCGGSLIDSRTVVTAAHCVDEGFAFQIYGGGVIGTGHQDDLMSLPKVESIITHSKHKTENFYDIAVINLSQEIDFDVIPNLEPIRIAPKEELRELLDDLNNELYATGWGQTNFSSSPLQLQKTSPLELMGDAKLDEVFAGLAEDIKKSDADFDPEDPKFISYLSFVKKAQEDLRVIGVTNGFASNTCFGDSGGPLVKESASGETFLVGITSFSLNRECGDHTFFTAVSNHIEWVTYVSSEDFREKVRAARASR